MPTNRYSCVRSEGPRTGTSVPYRCPGGRAPLDTQVVDDPTSPAGVERSSAPSHPWGSRAASAPRGGSERKPTCQRRENSNTPPPRWDLDGHAALSAPHALPRSRSAMRGCLGGGADVRRAPSSNRCAGNRHDQQPDGSPTGGGISRLAFSQRKAFRRDAENLREVLRRLPEELTEEAKLDRRQGRLRETSMAAMQRWSPDTLNGDPRSRRSAPPDLDTAEHDVRRPDSA